MPILVGGSAEEGMTTRYAYRAFISYSHRDKVFATALHRRLEAYRVPARLVGRKAPLGDAPRRLTPIFRDRDELPASADLSTDLRAAIEVSMFLIVVCSPASAVSRWVEQEIIHFKLTHGEGRVLAVIADGAPNVSDVPGREHEECLPRALRFRMTPQGEVSDDPAEPMATDARRTADGPRLARLKLVAGLTGLKLDDLVRRDRRRALWRLATAATAALALAVGIGALAIYTEARQKKADADRAVLLNNRGLGQSDAGRYAAADKDLKESLALFRRDLGDDALKTGKGWFALATNSMLAKRPGDAEGQVAQCVAILRRRAPNSAFLADALSLQGEILQANGKPAQAEPVLRQAEAAYREIGAPRDLLGVAEVYRALALSDLGRTDEALAVLDDARRNYDIGYGKLHANHGDLMVQRAIVLAKAGRMSEARTACAAGLKIVQQKLGDEAEFTHSEAEICAKLGPAKTAP